MNEQGQAGPLAPVTTQRATSGLSSIAEKSWKRLGESWRSLRGITFSVLMLAFIGLALVQWISMRSLYDSGIDNAEHEDVRARANHARALAVQRARMIMNYAIDNGDFDDAFAYMHGADPTFPDRLFGMNTYERMRMTGYAFLTPAKRVVRAGEYDSTLGKFVGARMELIDTLRPDRDVAARLGNEPAQGFVEIGSQLFAWGSAPVRHSDGSGPVAGYLVTFSPLDHAYLQEVSRAVDAVVEVVTGQRSASRQGLPSANAETARVDVMNVDANGVSAVALLAVLRNNEDVSIRVTRPRALHALMVRASRYGFITTLGFGILVCLLVLRFIARHLLQPVKRASDQLNEIGASGDLTARLDAAPRIDEIERLVNATNAMLAQLESKRNAEAARDEAEAASRAKSEFLATMSHEIRTPMNGVLGLNELLLQSQLTGQQRAWAEAVQASGRQLMGILNDVLDYSKIESGRMQLESVECNLVELVDEAVAMYAQAAARKGLELVVDHAVPRTYLGVQADPLRLRQVLANLVGNAVKFTPSGEVILRVTDTGDAGGDAQLRFTVEDTGVGIAADARDHIFEHFSQADGSATREFGGAGLGLAICRKLLTLMGGSIRVESVVDRGSKFIVDLRLPRARRRGVAEPAMASLTGVPVLIADDNQTVRRLLERTLTSWGMKATSVADYGTVLQTLTTAASQGRPFRLLLLDAPANNAERETRLKEIRARPELAELALVLLTAPTSPSDDSHGPGFELDGYVHKPIRLSDLQRVLGRIFRIAVSQSSGDGAGSHRCFPQAKIGLSL